MHEALSQLVYFSIIVQNDTMVEVEYHESLMLHAKQRHDDRSGLQHITVSDT